MFGNYFGKKEIIELMVNHPQAKKMYSKRIRSITKKYGHLVIKLFGYPLGVTARQRAKIIMKYLDPKKEEVILDAGCGIGIYSFELLTKYGSEVHGADIDAEDIKLANRIRKKTGHSNLAFYVGNISYLPFRDQIFDKIILLDVIAHVVDDRKVLNDLFRVLKPNGYLILSTPYRDVMRGYYTNNPPMNGRRLRNGYSFERLAEILNDAGFKIEEYKYFAKKFTKEVGVFAFLLAYTFSKLDYLCRGTGTGIVVKVKK